MATCVTPTDRGGPLTRAMGLGSNKSASPFIHFIFSPLTAGPATLSFPLDSILRLEIFAFRRMRLGPGDTERVEFLSS